MIGGVPQISFTFPYRWINDPEDRKYLGENFKRQIQKSGLKQIYQSSPTDKYFAQHGNSFVSSYAAVLKYHAFQPVKIKLTKNQLEEYLKDIFPEGKLVSYQPFFVQTSNPSALLIMELEIYY